MAKINPVQVKNMNIFKYLDQPSFEDFVDAPVGADQLAHNSAAPGAEAPVGAPGAPVEASPTNLEIPESVGPALVASSDEVQAAAIVEDPGHSQAAQDAAAASDASTAQIEQAQVAPAETGSAEPALGDETAPVSEPTADGETGEEDGLGESTDSGDGFSDTSDDGAAGGDELGGDDLSNDASGLDDNETDTPTEDGLGETESTDVVDESETGDEFETETEEDGLGDETTDGLDETEGENEDLGDGAESEAETGEAEGEESEEETESEESEEETTDESESESEEADDDEDGVDLDIPDVDTETTAEDVDEAEEEADEAVAEDEELEKDIVDTSKSVAELEDDEVAVEEFIGVLQHGIRTQKFNTQTVALAQSKLQRLANQWGGNAPLIPSMEDYTSSNLGEYYTNSLESFSGFLKRIKHVRDQWMDNFAKSMNDKMHLKAVETQIAAINKALDVQILRVKELELTEAVTVKVPKPIRGEGGPVKSVTAELKWLNDVAGIFAHDRKFLESLSGLFGSAVKETNLDKSNSIVNKALKLPLPVKSYPASIYEGSKLAVFQFDKVEKKATGSMVDDLKTLGDRAIPESGHTNVGIGSGPETVQLKKTDLVKMLQLAKILIGLSRGTAAAAGKNIVDTIDAVNRSKSELNQKGEDEDKTKQAQNEKALSSLHSQFWVAVSNSTDNYTNFQWHLILLADHLVHTVQKVKGTAAK